MKHWRILVTAVLVAGCLGVAWAGGANTTVKEKPKKTTPVFTGSSELTSADDVAKSITVRKSGETKTYKVMSDATIEINGAAARLADLKPGMQVTITPTKVDPNVLNKISAIEVKKDKKR